MSLNSKIKKLFEQLTDTHICRRPCRGIEFAQDLSFSLPLFEVRNIFDVGANVGQSARVFLAEFPSAQLYCFEPVSNAYTQLQRNLAGNARVECFRVAFSSAKGEGRMVMPGTSDISFLQSGSRVDYERANLSIESVLVDTIDDFCAASGIDQISYVKIDTEGGDLEVLKGSVRMLTEQKIDLVQVEAGMNPKSSQFVSFEVLKTFLESFGYFLFGIYDQKNEFPTGEAHLRRTNPVFVSQQLIRRYAKASTLG
jgi:FkbM family methyltransferase